MKISRVTLNKLGAILCFVLVYFPSINAQEVSKSRMPDRDKAIEYAHRCLNGKGVELNYKKAFYIFSKLAKDKDAEALNALGMIYKHGLGPKQNDKKAFTLFSESSKLGYAKGSYNVGLNYKYGHGVEQNFFLAFQYFEKSKEQGYKNTDYIIGYSYYKGLGIEQSYEKAFSHFKSGAEAGNAQCMYMLGYCYLRGRGTEQNTKIGKYWIEESAYKGNSKAMDFMAYKKDIDQIGKKNVKLKSVSEEPINAFIPARYPKLKNAVTGNEMEGEWQGKLISYDWSGKEIESEKPLRLILKTNGGTIHGIWIESDTIQGSLNITNNDSVMVFDNTLLYEDKRVVEIKDAYIKKEYKNNEEYLIGNISFYCEQIREFQSPRFIALKRGATISEEQLVDLEQSVSVYPNPFQNLLNININLQQPDQLSFTIFDLSGKLLLAEKSNQLGSGEQKYSIQTDLIPKGTYILQVKGNNLRKSIKIIK